MIAFRTCARWYRFGPIWVTLKGDVKALPVYGEIDVDFYGHPITGTNRMPGPFADLTATTGSRAIDPQ